LLTIINYNAGNIRSIQNMLKKIGVTSSVSNNIKDIEKAEKLILPGVGSFDYGMKQLHELGLISILNKKILFDKTPILGICLGVQLMTQKSEEGFLPGLGWFNASVVKFNFSDLSQSYKIPHMNWAEINIKKETRLFSGFTETPRFYFVHSYHLKTENNIEVSATTTHGYEFAAALEKENIIGVQFHPEKSHKFGMQVLRNFIDKY